MKKVHEANVSRCYFLTEEGSIGFENGGKDQKKLKTFSVLTVEGIGVFTNGVHPATVNPTYISP